MDVLADGAWEKIFKVKPAVFTAVETVSYTHLDVYKRLLSKPVSLLLEPK